MSYREILVLGTTFACPQGPNRQSLDQARIIICTEGVPRHWGGMSDPLQTAEQSSHLGQGQKRKREGGDSGDGSDAAARREACAAAALRRFQSSASCGGPVTAAAGTLATDGCDGPSETDNIVHVSEAGARPALLWQHFEAAFRPCSNADVCSICLEACGVVSNGAATATSSAFGGNLEEEAATPGKTLPCGHMFHASCWQGAEMHGTHMTCPNCRARVHSSVLPLPMCHGDRGQWQACANPALHFVSACVDVPPFPTHKHRLDSLHTKLQACRHRDRAALRCSVGRCGGCCWDSSCPAHNGGNPLGGTWVGHSRTSIMTHEPELPDHIRRLSRALGYRYRARF